MRRGEHDADPGRESRRRPALVRMVQKSASGGLQEEADATALAVAAALAQPSEPDGPGLSATAAEVALGRWDAFRRRFVATGSSPNAVEVTVRGSQAASEVGRGWLSRIISPPLAATATSAVAAVRPRDIVFVVDLSCDGAESLAAPGAPVAARHHSGKRHRNPPQSLPGPGL